MRRAIWILPTLNNDSEPQKILRSLRVLRASSPLLPVLANQPPLHAESGQPVPRRPSLVNLEIFDSPEAVFLDHGEKRRSDLARVT